MIPPWTRDRARTLRRRSGPRSLATLSLTGTLSLAAVGAFGSLGGDSQLASATGNQPNGTCGFCVLAPSGEALKLSGSGNVSLTKANVIVNSSSKPAVTLSGSGSLKAPSVGVVGTASVTGSGKIENLTTGITAVSDPLSGLAVPSLTVPNPVPSVSVTGSTGKTAEPGVYKEITDTASGSLTLNPGTYVVLQKFANTGSGALTAKGVTLYLACSSYPTPCKSGEKGATLSLTGSGPMNFTGPEAGCSPVAVFSDRNSTAPLAITGSGSQTLNGVLYAKSGSLALVGSGGTFTIGGPIVVASSTTSGSGGISITGELPMTEGLALSLSPSPASAHVGEAETLTATLSCHGKPLATQPVTFTVTGANPHTEAATTNSSGVATFSYTGKATGNDTAKASYTANGSSVASSPASIAWSKAQPSISTKPAASTVTIGEAISDTATVSGGYSPTGTVGFNVYAASDTTCKTPLNEKPLTATLAGGEATSPSFTPSSPGSYQFVASYGGDSSNEAVAGKCGEASEQVNVEGVIGPFETQPQSVSVNDGQAASFAAVSPANPAATAQWQLSTNGGASWSNDSTDTPTTTSSSGKTTSTLKVSSASRTQNGYEYRVVFTNAAGSVTSNSATLTVDWVGPITTQPQGETVNEGSPVSFTAAASANPTASVQWQVSTNGGSSWGNDTSDAGNNTTTLTISSAKITQNGYEYRAVFSNAAGTVTTASVDPEGHRTSYGYDTAGRITSTTDPNGATTTQAYDPAGRLTEMKDAVGGTVRFAYDPEGNLLSATEPDGRTSSETYDAAGRRVSEANPATGTRSYSYDASGNLLTQTNGAGETVTDTYDAANQLITQSGPGVSNAFSYDAAGRQVSASDQTGTTTRRYDEAGELLSEETPQGSLAWTYGPNGLPASMTIPTGATVAYEYDAANHLIGLTDPLGERYSMGYDGAGNQTSIVYPNGVDRAVTYTPANRVATITDRHGTVPIAQLAYGYDAAGNRSSESGPSGEWIYGYDPLSRLTTATGPQGRFAFTYDPAGNITAAQTPTATRNITYNSAGQLVADGQQSYSYDSAGNRISAGANTYVYNALGQMTSVQSPGGTTDYSYSAAGLRVSATTGAATTQTLWDTQGETPEPVVNGSDRFIYAESVPLEQIEGVTSTQLLTDALGSIRAATDGTGAIVGTKAFSPFGTEESQTGATSALGYTGALTDATGLIYDQARFYDPATGQFTSPDTVVPNGPGTQGYNLYAYVENNPATYTDPSGHVGEINELSTAQFVAARLASGAIELLPRARQLAALGAGLATVIGVYGSHQLVSHLEGTSTNFEGPHGWLYRGGANNPGNLIPRNADPAQWPNDGLSTFTSATGAWLESGKKPVVTEIEENPVIASGDLMTVGDPDPSKVGHVFITPTELAGGETRLESWRNSAGEADPFTALVKSASTKRPYPAGPFHVP